ncbi:MAG: hypothetical protein HQL20_08800 [Candidatus Omnitrophica bacterium]|nr:hypothetical protein [Candidatus Omnitrophota bacterium]
MPLDLITTEFPSAGIFTGLPKFTALSFLGAVPSHFLKYRIVAGGVEQELLTASVIRRSEAMVWEGAKDLLGRAVATAAGRVRGIYAFELLAFNVQQELASFNFNELSQVLVNSALLLHPGGEMLIRYCSVFGVLRKLVDEAWGKMHFTAVAGILPDEPGSIAALLGRGLKTTASAAGPVIILVNDLSAVPLYDSNCCQQQAALAKLEKKLTKSVVPFPRECWVEGVRIIPGQ